MIRLVAVELRRYLHRRAVLLLLVACVAVPVLLGTVAVTETAPPSDAEIAFAQRQLEQDRAASDYSQIVADCVASPADFGLPGLTGAELEEQCRAQVEPQLEWYLDNRRLDLDDERRGSGAAVASFLAILLLLAGTTFTGHDWASRSVSNQLLFEPRRGRVWAAKAVVVTGAALVVGAIVMTTYFAGLGLVASSRDVLADGQLLDAFQMGWRSAGVAAVGALLGFSLTTLFRSTVATIGLLLGVAVAGSLLLAALGVEERWNPAINLAALVQDGTTYYSESACVEDPGMEGPLDEDGYYHEPCTEEVTFADASAYVGSFVLVAGVASLVSFRRRDVP
ncbi:MAG TPA: hypothetical protein VNT31_12875 [Nocardioides sp.]|nr:hypothetical protein [Nocardioides sp.]